MVPTWVLVGSPKAKCNTNNKKIASHPKKKEKETSHTKDFKGGKKKKFIKKGGNCRTQNPQ